MTVAPNKRIKSGYIIAFSLLLAAYLLIFFTIQQLIRETGAISNSYLYLNKLQSLKAEVADAETGVGSYVATGDVIYLRSYNSSSRNFPQLLDELRSMATRREKYPQLRELVERRMHYLSETVRLYQTSGFRVTAEIERIKELGRGTMDSIRHLVNGIAESENMQMTKRKNQLSRSFSGTKSIAIFSLVITLFAVFFSWATYSSENRARQSEEQKAQRYRDELESNIEQLRQANTELDELKSIEKFAATGRIARTIAHEVRNPLTNISLATEQLRELDQREETKMLHDMISRNADRINRLVSELLNATRFAQLNFRTIRIHELVDGALDMAVDRIRLNQVAVEKEYSAESCTVKADPEKMKLAFLNIIVNAIEAMPREGGRLKLRTWNIADKCFVEIRDNGTGMDEETMQKLFDPYFTGKRDGTGLGLTNSQNIIFNHRGNIRVSSQPGQGSSFVVSMNVA